MDSIGAHRNRRKRITGNDKVYGHSIIALARCLSALLAIMSFGAYAEDSAFTEALRQARAYDPDEPPSNVAKDKLKAAEYYRHALELRPNDPDNLRLSFHLGANLMAMDHDRTHQLEGLEVNEDLLCRYRYLDYYRKQHEGVRDSPEYMMVYAAINAGETRHSLLNDPEKARLHFFKGMEMLNQTYQRRLEDWRNEPKPEKSPNTGLVTSSSLKWENRLRNWEQRQERVDAGEIFDTDIESRTVESLVRHYVGTFGRVKPEELSSILQPVINAFPNSPFEKEARRVIDAVRTKAKVNAERPAVGGEVDSANDPVCSR